MPKKQRAQAEPVGANSDGAEVSQLVGKSRSTTKNKSGDRPRKGKGSASHDSQDTTRLIKYVGFYTIIFYGSSSRLHPTTLATPPML